jgi:hypothetical protein
MPEQTFVILPDESEGFWSALDYKDINNARLSLHLLLLYL